MSHAGRNGITTIVLDTPSVSVRSHQFYKRQGFVQVTAADLPVRYDFPDRNSLFFRLDLAPL
jgi:predicted N-acetyltransferase YhbS